MCAAVTYSPGDVVWAKVPRYPWWPAEVIAQEDCKIANHGKKNPIAYITFPCEDAYDIIRSESNIMPFYTEHEKNYIKKGENLPNDLSERFLLALKCAQKAAKDNTDVTQKSSSVKNPSDSIFDSSLNSNPSVVASGSQNQTDVHPESPPTTPVTTSTITGYTNETSDHLKYTCSQCNFSTCRLNLMLIHYRPEENVLRCPSLLESIVVNADSRKRRMLENDAYLRSQHFKAPRRLSTPEVTSRVPCYARKPASPPPQKALPATPHDIGSCYMFHDEPIRQPAHKPSFSYRSLQKKKDNSCVGDNENSKRSISSFTQPKTYTKLKSSKDQRNGVLSLDNIEKRKELQIKPSNDSSSPLEHKLERPNRKPHSSGEKKSNGEKDEQEEESSRKKVLCSEKKNTDSNQENKSGSSDESSFCTDDETTDTISSTKSDLPVVENDAVWVKFNKYPFWPALISQVYKKKHHIYRLGIRFFGEILSKESLEFGIRYNKESVIPFHDSRKEEFIEKGEESEFKEKFSLALKNVNEFLKKGDFEVTSDNTDQYIYKSSCSSPDPSQYDKTDAENSMVSEPSWYSVDNMNIVEDRQTVEMVSSVLVDTPEDVCQTVLELDNSEPSKELSTVSVMPEIWIPSVEETTVDNEVVLHDIDAEVLIPTATD